MKQNRKNLNKTLNVKNSTVSLCWWCLGPLKFLNHNRIILQQKTVKLPDLWLKSVKFSLFFKGIIWLKAVYLASLGYWAVTSESGSRIKNRFKMTIKSQIRPLLDLVLVSHQTSWKEGVVFKVLCKVLGRKWSAHTHRKSDSVFCWFKFWFFIISIPSKFCRPLFAEFNRPLKFHKIRKGILWMT